MPASEIDEIFSGKLPSSAVKKDVKGKARAAEPSPTPAVAPSKKSRKRKRAPEGAAGEQTPKNASQAKSSPEPPRRIPETVHDPSATLGERLAGKKRRKEEAKKSFKVKSKPKEADEDGEDDIARFRDSRGTGPRRRTEEGFLIYKEDELGIKDAGGDTPLCPFDCDCCF